ncbi:uncharacterized protein [Diabrotica undecimpunctata]|uniref:uncharacterized protein n=1 Tax=Diabrotica undecimpunctata TaxID=50387 RepID=UPI003B63B9FC
MALDTLKTERKVLKAGITRIFNWFNINQDSELDILHFENRERQLRSYFQQYEVIQHQIECSEDADIESSDRDDVECKYFNALAGIQRKIKDINEIASNVDSLNISKGHGSRHSIRLPEITMKVFTGEFSDWNSFIQLFSTLVIENPDLNDLQRLIYLKTHVSGEPLELIKSLEVIDTNFHIALNTLKERYDNKARIVSSLIKKLLKIPSLVKCSPQSLRNFLTNIKQTMQSLSNMQIPVQHWDLILIELILEKVDFNSHKAFEYELGSKEIPTLAQLFTFLEKRCEILEKLHSSNTQTQKSNSSSYARVTHLSNIENKTNNLRCLFCSQNHKIYNCNGFKSSSLQEKLKFVNTRRLCRNCLGTRHFTANCGSQSTCSICHGRHHSLLHKDNHVQYSTATQRSLPPEAHIIRNDNNSLNGNNSQHSRSNNSTNKDITRPNNLHVFQHNTPFNQPDTSSHDTQHAQSGIQAHSHSHSFDSQDVTQSFSALSLTNEVILATALVTLVDKDKNLVHARALLDNGSQTSFITQELVNRLGLPSYNRLLKISTLSQSCSTSNKMIDLIIYPFRTTHNGFNVSCAVLPTITCKLPQVKISRSHLSIPHDINLADHSFSVPGKIDMLLGNDIYCDLLTDGIIKLGNGPILQNTHLGYIFQGRLPSQSIPNYPLHISDNNKSSCFSTQVSLCINSVNNTEPLDALIQRFWEVEELPESPMLSQDDELAEHIFKTTTKLLPEGRFQVDLPLRSSAEPKRLGNSFYSAKQRFHNLERKLVKDNTVYTQYKDFIQEYLSLGHAKVVPLTLTNPMSDNKYFIPHHCIIREEKLTNKLRVVFDCSMKTSSGVSLNDIMLKGYKTQPELIDTLINFRTFLYVFTSDLRHMYRQILINPTQRYLLNILWRNSPQDELQCIQLNTVTYGTNCGNFLSCRCLLELARTHQESYPLASDAILNACYVDDMLYGADDPTNLLKAYFEITELLNKVGISVHKWCSNSQTFLENVSSRSHDSNYVIAPENGNSKVLGLYWNANSDVFLISVPRFSQESLIKTTYTKREVLSLIAQIFDPEGLVAPVVIIAKLIMRKIWLAKIDWDDHLSSEILKEWLKFIQGLSCLQSLKIPRCFFKNKNIRKIEIHGFSDASIHAYAACVYIRVIYDSNTFSCALIASKSRVAPLKIVSLPRLELMGAVICSKLTQRIVSTLKIRIPQIDSINLWSDSEIVLAWLKSPPSRWTPFVANRVATIQQNSEFIWRYVKSKENPADILSRGISPLELPNSALWFNGPHFLSQIDLDLTLFNSKNKINHVPEERKSQIVHHAQVSSSFLDELIRPFSSFTNLQRVIAYCLRFAHNTRKPSEKFSNNLSVSELKSAELKIVKLIQDDSFSQEISLLKTKRPITNKSLLSMNPFLDEHEMLRVGERLKYASVPFDQKYPLLLPSKNRLVKLMLRREHIRLCHAGPQCTLSNFRLKYWPLDALREIKRIINSCKICFRFKAQTASQLMADLPRERLVCSQAFTNVGTDLGGPYNLKTSKLRKAPITKCYIVVFICMVTRACHLELVSNLTTESFVLTLKRFISRRGNPSVIFSDNATNFLGSKNQLKEFAQFLRNQDTQNSIKNFLTSSEITWKFIPPHSPHHGGIWESAIKSAKYHLHRLIGNLTLTFEEFSTVLAQIEAVLNSRPLCAMSNQPGDLSVLTPGHFLIGKPLTSFPESDVSEISSSRLNLLNRLQNRPKWLTSNKDIKVNDLVLLKEDNTPPLYWPLARVIEVFHGNNGKVRVVNIRTKDGTFTRPITKLCPLPEEYSV